MDVQLRIFHRYTTGFSPSVVTTEVTIGIELETLVLIDKSGRVVAARFIGKAADAVPKDDG